MPMLKSASDVTRQDKSPGNHLQIPNDTPPERIRIARFEKEARAVRIQWADGHVSHFHFIWLRHNCFCPVCGDSGDGIRFNPITSIPSQIVPHSVELDGTGNLVVGWDSNGHRSEFGPEWLRAYCYSDEERARRNSFVPKLWKSDFIDRVPDCEFLAIMENEASRLIMFENLRDYGLVRVKSVGLDAANTERLANLFGPIHETNEFGYIYDVKSRPVAKFGAQTAMHQDPHHDDVFQYMPPGIDIFHCLVNTGGHGGESTYVDGYSIAESLRMEEPEAFRLLTTVPIQHNRRHPGSVDFRSTAHVIRLDHEGKVSGVRYQDRAVAPLDVPGNLIEPMFEAQRQYIERMTSSAFKIEFLVRPGEGVIIDNQRVMHGRNSFDTSTGRHVRLCVVDREEFHARLRDLGARLGRSDYDLRLPAGAVLP